MKNKNLSGISLLCSFAIFIAVVLAILYVNCQNERCPECQVCEACEKCEYEIHDAVKCFKENSYDDWQGCFLEACYAKNKCGDDVECKTNCASAWNKCLDEHPGTSEDPEKAKCLVDYLKS